MAIALNAVAIAPLCDVVNIDVILTGAMTPSCDVVFLAGDAGDNSPATTTNPWAGLTHLFQDVQKLNGHERGI